MDICEQALVIKANSKVVRTEEKTKKYLFIYYNRDVIYKELIKRNPCVR